MALRDGRYSGRPWSAAEDRLLRESVALHGLDWKKAAAHVGNGRTNRGCRQRWLLRLQESVNKTPITSRERARILELCQHYGKQWKKIADDLGSGHNADQVREVVMNRSEGRKSWTEAEDALLRRAVQTHGVGKWAAVARMVPGRSDASCYSRWTFSVNPELVRGDWSEEEDKRLLAAVRMLEKSGEQFHFGDVAVLMGNRRHRKACRVRYNWLVRRDKQDRRSGVPEAATRER